MGYSSDSNAITRDYFDSILIVPKYLDSELPSLETTILGGRFSTPVMTAALSHLHKICDNAMSEIAAGAKASGAVHFVGMTEEDELEQILSTGAKTVKIIKPHKDDEIIYKKLHHAIEHGAMAVGMDIDHSVSNNGGYDFVLGYTMRTKSRDQLSEYINEARKSNVPFVVKGVLDPREAEWCCEAGAQAIIVSHHHGIQSYAVPPLMMLPEIVRAVDGRLQIFVDCGIESGADVYKALALGADAVCVGRAFMEPLKEGRQGIIDKFTRINNELSVIMARTGATNVKEIDPASLRFRAF